MLTNSFFIALVVQTAKQLAIISTSSREHGGTDVMVQSRRYNSFFASLDLLGVIPPCAMRIKNKLRRPGIFGWNFKNHNCLKRVLPIFVQKPDSTNGSPMTSNKMSFFGTFREYGKLDNSNSTGKVLNHVILSSICFLIQVRTSAIWKQRWGSFNFRLLRKSGD